MTQAEIIQQAVVLRSQHEELYDFYTEIINILSNKGIVKSKELAPVIHSRWVPVYGAENVNGERMFKCINCGKMLKQSVVKESRHCLYCGAIMDL